MIVVDTSAIVAILLHEPARDACAAVIDQARGVSISAGTLYELLTVSRRRGIGAEVEAMMQLYEFEAHPVDAAFARRAAATYDRWGKGIDPAGLNLADCFAYTLARDLGCPLLYIGNDFAKTDIASAI